MRLTIERVFNTETFLSLAKCNTNSSIFKCFTSPMYLSVSGLFEVFPAFAILAAYSIL